MSLRGIGEGHMSSIEFRSGVVRCRRIDHGRHSERIRRTRRVRRRLRGTRPGVVRGHVRDPAETSSSRVLFPHSPAESHGLEDARFVRFVDDDANPAVYYATYTAFDGHQIVPHLLETDDFTSFRATPLSGARREEQGHCDLPTPDRRPVRRARSPRQRQQLRDDVARRPRLGPRRDDPGARTAVGADAVGQLRLTARDRGRLAGDHARRRPDAHLQPGRPAARSRRPDARHRTPEGAVARRPTPTSAKGTSPTSCIRAAASSTPGT